MDTSKEYAEIKQWVDDTIAKYYMFVGNGPWSCDFSASSRIDPIPTAPETIKWAAESIQILLEDLTKAKARISALEYALEHNSVVDECKDCMNYSSDKLGEIIFALRNVQNDLDDTCGSL